MTACNKLLNMRLQVAGLTDIGMKRSQNQDSLLILPEKNVFVVADGMGGHKGGEIASALAVEKIAEFFNKNEQKSDSTCKRVYSALESANRAIFTKSKEDITLNNMGTTTVLFYFEKKNLFIGHVGDSRGYLINQKGFWQLTEDHSLVQEKIKAGIINREQAKTDKQRHVLTRSVGVEENAEIDVYQHPIETGDVYLSCSDGLHGLVADTVIQEIVSKRLLVKKPEKEAIGKAVEELINLAKQNGGDDNVTVFIAQVM